MWIPTDEEVAYYKTLAQDQAPNDDYYKAMLPLLLEKVNEDYNQSFEPSTAPGNVKIFIAKATQFFGGNAGLKSRKMGSVSYGFDFTELPSSYTNLLLRYRKVKFHVL